MEYALGIGVYALFELVLGWPLFLIASAILAAYLRSVRVLPWSRVFWAVVLAWPLAVVVALIVWRWWPPSFGAPMWRWWPLSSRPPMWSAYFHVPALFASLIAFPLAAWWARIGARPNKSLNADAQTQRAG